MKKARHNPAKHPEASTTSLKEMPDVDFSKPRVRKNHHAARSAKDITVQVGGGRRKKLEEVDGTSPRSVRLTDEVWMRMIIEARTKKRCITLHTAPREAILAQVEEAA